MDTGTVLEECSREIAAFRQRQITTFRESAIVQALITYGITQLNPAPEMVRTLHTIAAVACVLSSLLGCWIILIFKRRIQIARSQRSALVLSADKSGTWLKEDGGFLPGGSGYRSSTAYIAALLVMGAFMTCANLVLGWMREPSA